MRKCVSHSSEGPSCGENPFLFVPPASDNFAKTARQPRHFFDFFVRYFQNDQTRIGLNLKILKKGKRSLFQSSGQAKIITSPKLFFLLFLKVEPLLILFSFKNSRVELSHCLQLIFYLLHNFVTQTTNFIPARFQSPSSCQDFSSNFSDKYVFFHVIKMLNPITSRLSNPTISCSSPDPAQVRLSVCVLLNFRPILSSIRGQN